MKPPRKRPGLETGAVAAVQHFDVQATPAVECRSLTSQASGLVRRIIENLDLKMVSGVVERGHSVDGALDNVPLDVDRNLDGDDRKSMDRVSALVNGAWPRCSGKLRDSTSVIAPVMYVEKDQDERVESVCRQPDGDERVQDGEDRHEAPLLKPDPECVDRLALEPSVARLVELVDDL
jgi:hypothetical protein